MWPSLRYRTSYSGANAYLFIYLFAASEVPKTVTIKSAVFWEMTRRSPVEIHGHSSETSPNFNQTMQHHIQQDRQYSWFVGYLKKRIGSSGGMASE
jgi:hypothetical protein